MFAATDPVQSFLRLESSISSFQSVRGGKWLNKKGEVVTTPSDPQFFKNPLKDEFCQSQRRPDVDSRGRSLNTEGAEPQSTIPGVFSRKS